MIVEGVGTNPVSSHANTFEYEAVDTYTNGNMYCVLFEKEEGQNIVHKYPINSLFRVIEVHPENCD